MPADIGRRPLDEAAAERQAQPAVQRGSGGKVKGFLGRLAARVFNVRKRIKKIKLKLQRLLIKVLGLRQPLQDLQSEQVTGIEDLRGAQNLQQLTAASAEEVSQQLEQAKSRLAETESS